jgi:hypothetical protein
MKIPTEPIGSIPRPPELIAAIEQVGDYADPSLDPLYDSRKAKGKLDSSRGGVGFGGIRERLRQLGGSLEVQSNGTGTVVRATLLLT